MKAKHFSSLHLLSIIMNTLFLFFLIVPLVNSEVEFKLSINFFLVFFVYYYVYYYIYAIALKNNKEMQMGLPFKDFDFPKYNYFTRKIIISYLVISSFIKFEVGLFDFRAIIYFLISFGFLGAIIIYIEKLLLLYAFRDTK